jgi:hypothetical protein
VALDPVAIHSARVLVGETLSLTKQTGVTASVEALFNLNKETKAIDVNTGTPGVDPFKDTRVNGKVGLSSTICGSSSASASASQSSTTRIPRRGPCPGAPAGAKFSPLI